MMTLLSGLKESLSIPASLLDRLYRTLCGAWFIAAMCYIIPTQHERPLSFFVEPVESIWAVAGRIMDQWVAWIDGNRPLCLELLAMLGVVLVLWLQKVCAADESYIPDSGRAGSSLLLVTVLTQQAMPPDWNWLWWCAVGLIPVLLFFISALGGRTYMLAKPLLTAVVWPISEVWDVIVGDATSQPVARGAVYNPIYVKQVNDEQVVPPSRFVAEIPSVNPNVMLDETTYQPCIRNSHMGTRHKHIGTRLGHLGTDALRVKYQGLPTRNSDHTSSGTKPIPDTPAKAA